MEPPSAAPSHVDTNRKSSGAHIARTPRQRSLSGTSETPSSTSSASNDMSASLYKTEPCRSFDETGFCRYGLKCRFAHGAQELRAVARHRKYKTEPCKNYNRTGNCPYGSRCRFVHDKRTPQNTPTAANAATLEYSYTDAVRNPPSPFFGPLSPSLSTPLVALQRDSSPSLGAIGTPTSSSLRLTPSSPYFSPAPSPARRASLDDLSRLSLPSPERNLSSPFPSPALVGEGTLTTWSPLPQSPDSTEWPLVPASQNNTGPFSSLQSLSLGHNMSPVTVTVGSGNSASGFGVSMLTGQGRDESESKSGGTGSIPRSVFGFDMPSSFGDKPSDAHGASPPHRHLAITHVPDAVEEKEPVTVKLAKSYSDGEEKGKFTASSAVISIPATPHPVGTKRLSVFQNMSGDEPKGAWVNNCSPSFPTAAS